jgi:hypothetical protein
VNIAFSCQSAPKLSSVRASTDEVWLKPARLKTLPFSRLGATGFGQFDPTCDSPPANSWIMVFILSLIYSDSGGTHSSGRSASGWRYLTNNGDRRTANSGNIQLDWKYSRSSYSFFQFSWASPASRDAPVWGSFLDSTVHMATRWPFFRFLNLVAQTSGNWKRFAPLVPLAVARKRQQEQQNQDDRFAHIARE